MQKIGLIKVRFSLVLYKLEITSKFKIFHTNTIDFSKKKDLCLEFAQKSINKLSNFHLKILHAI